MHAPAEDDSSSSSGSAPESSALRTVKAHGGDFPDLIAQITSMLAALRKPVLRMPEVATKSLLEATDTLARLIIRIEDVEVPAARSNKDKSRATALRDLLLPAEDAALALRELLDGQTRSRRKAAITTIHELLRVLRGAQW
jgi:hypothetical protein